MEFSYSQEQTALKETAGRLFSARFTDEFRKAFARDDQPYDRFLWARSLRPGFSAPPSAPRTGARVSGSPSLRSCSRSRAARSPRYRFLRHWCSGALPLQRFGTAAQQALLRQVVAGRAAA